MLFSRLYICKMKALTVLLISLTGVSLEADAEPCKPENARARTVLEDFIGDADWAEERTETGATGLTISQIQLLSDDEDDIPEDMYDD